MAKISSKKDYLNKLGFGLSFCYSDSDREKILADITEWFDSEAALGKSEADICAGLGSPRGVIRNYLSEEQKGTGKITAFLSSSIVQNILFILIYCLVGTVILQRMSLQAFNYLYAGALIIFAYFLVVFFSYYAKSYRYISHELIMRFRRYNIIIDAVFAVSLIFQLFIVKTLSYPHGARIYLGVLICLFAGVILTNIVFLRNFYGSCVLCRIFTFRVIGILSVIFYLRNQQSMIYDDITQIRSLIAGSILLYAETILLGAVLYKQAAVHSKKREENGCSA